MININYKIKKEQYLILLLIALGLYLRHVNLFFEDYWADEMLGFANSDPKITLSETLKKIETSIEKTPLLFHILIKYFYKFFGYFPENGRFFTLLIGVAVIPVMPLICRELNNKKSSLLLSFLVCTNIYLINYSQEVRPYILLFFISAINIYIFLKLINNPIKNKFFWFFYFLLISILGFLTHPFFFIILISEAFFCFIKVFYYDKNLKKVFFIIAATSLVCLFLQYEYIFNLLQDKGHWIDDHSKKYGDLFFPKFFGSKIMGAIYFIFLSTLIIKYRKKVFSIKNNYIFFIFLIFFSYFLPLAYGFAREHILYDRYVIFILIPILTLISILIYEIKKIKLRIALISILLISTLSNLYIEIKNKTNYKPEVKKLLLSINNLDNQEYKKNIFISIKDNPPNLIEYILKLDEYNKNDFTIIEEKKLLKNDFWLICYTEPNGVICPFEDDEKKFKTKKIIQTYRTVAKYYFK